YLRCVFSLLLLSPPSSTLFPYTTLFRSDQSRARRAAPDRAGRRMGRGDVGVAFGARVAVPPGRGGRHDGAVGAFGSAAHAHIAGEDGDALAVDGPAARVDVAARGNGAWLAFV